MWFKKKKQTEQPKQPVKVEISLLDITDMVELLQVNITEDNNNGTQFINVVVKVKDQASLYTIIDESVMNCKLTPYILREKLTDAYYKEYELWIDNKRKFFLNPEEVIKMGGFLRFKKYN